MQPQLLTGSIYHTLAFVVVGVLLKDGGSGYPKGVKVWLDCAAVKMPQEGA